MSKRAIAVSLAGPSALVVPAVAQTLNNPTSYADGVNVRSNWSFTFGAKARGPLGTVLRDPNVGQILKGSDRFALTVDGRLLGWPDPAGAAVVQLVDVVDFTHGGTNDNTDLAVRADGTVWVRGQGNAGELGLGDARRAETITSFTQIPGLSGVVAVRAGDQSMFALDRLGRLWGWGSYDELSLPPLTPYVFRSVTSPTIIRTGVAEFDHAGRAGVVRKVDGSIEVFGGISGDDDFDAVMPLAFTSVNFGAVASLAASQSHVLLLRADGSLLEYGTRYSAEVSGFSRLAFNTPTRVAGLPAIKTVSVDYDGSTVALDRDGQVWAWGLIGINDLGLLENDLPALTSNVWINTPVRGLPGFGGWDKVWKTRQVTWIQKSNVCAPVAGAVVNVCGNQIGRLPAGAKPIGKVRSIGKCLDLTSVGAPEMTARCDTDWSVILQTQPSFGLNDLGTFQIGSERFGKCLSRPAGGSITLEFDRL